MSDETHGPLPLRKPGTTLPAKYRTGGSAWPSQAGRIAAVCWADSIDYELLERVRIALPHL